MHCINSMPTCVCIIQGIDARVYRAEEGRILLEKVAQPVSPNRVVCAFWHSMDGGEMPSICRELAHMEAGIPHPFLRISDSDVFFQQCRESEGLVRRPSLIMQVLQQKRL